jgi:adenylate cyclase class 2
MSSLNREIEIKLRVADAAAARRLLDGAGFSVTGERAFEDNEIWDTPKRSLWAKGEILRLRRYAGKSILTYKGPSEPGRHKTREEIEVAVSDAGAAETLLTRLGFERSYRYEKFRTEYGRAGEPGMATIDETPIGVFLELEGPGDWIDRLASELGFPLSEYLVLSYSTLYAQYCAESGLEPGLGMLYSSTEKKDT